MLALAVVVVVVADADPVAELDVAVAAAVVVAAVAVLVDILTSSCWSSFMHIDQQYTYLYFHKYPSYTRICTQV